MKKSLYFLFILCVMCFLVSACGEVPTLPGEEKKPKPSTEKADAGAYYGLKDDEYLIVTNGVNNSARAVVRQDSLYIPYEVAASWDNRWYWNPAEEELLFTNAAGIYKFWPGLRNHQAISEMIEDRISQVLMENTVLYINLDMLKSLSGVKVVQGDNPNRLVTFLDGTTMTGCLVKDVDNRELRTEPTVTSPILAVLKPGEKLFSVSSAEDGFAMVTTADGLTGYLQEEVLGDPVEETFSTGFEEPAYEHNLLSEEVHLVWHQMWAEQGGSDLRAMMSDVSGVNVVSPTWFEVASVDGSITSHANVSYVETAHRMGLQVWALVDDFAPGVPGLEVLSQSTSRANLISQLVNEVKRTGADGINIDFEYITKESAPHFIQFLRELSLVCRDEKLVLSVDNYVPDSGNAFYQLGSQKDVVDYIILMTYDEHHSKSEEAGSTASLPFVKGGVLRALKQVPKEQLVMGIPFFSRKWMTRTEEGKKVLGSEAGGMNTTRSFVENNGGTWTWDEECGQYYSEFTVGDVFYQVWLEDAKSIAGKLTVMEEMQIAGYACWKLGLESSDVWEVLNKTQER